MIYNPTNHEIWAVIHFLRATNTNAVEIHHELCAVYGQNVTSERTVRQGYRMLKEG
jgi:hypothetical protein